MLPGKDYIGVGCGAFILNEKNELLLQLRNKAPEKITITTKNAIENYQKLQKK